MKNLKRLAAALLALLLLSTVCAVAAEEPAPQEPPAAAGSELPDKDEPESAMPGVPPVGKPVEIIAPPGRAAETAARSAPQFPSLTNAFLYVEQMPNFTYEGQYWGWANFEHSFVVVNNSINSADAGNGWSGNPLDPNFTIYPAYCIQPGVADILPHPVDVSDVYEELNYNQRKAIAVLMDVSYSDYLAEWQANYAAVGVSQALYNNSVYVTVQRCIWEIVTGDPNDPRLDPDNGAFFSGWPYETACRSYFIRPSFAAQTENRITDAQTYMADGDHWDLIDTNHILSAYDIGRLNREYGQYVQFTAEDDTLHIQQVAKYLPDWELTVKAHRIGAERLPGHYAGIVFVHSTQSRVMGTFADPPYCAFKLQAIKGEIEIIKIDGNVLRDTEGAFQGVKYAHFKVIDDRDGEVMCEVVTDNNGYAGFAELPYGLEYRVVETAPPPHYTAFFEEAFAIKYNEQKVRKLAIDDRIIGKAVVRYNTGVKGFPQTGVSEEQTTTETVVVQPGETPTAEIGQAKQINGKWYRLAGYSFERVFPQGVVIQYKALPTQTVPETYAKDGRKLQLQQVDYTEQTVHNPLTYTVDYGFLTAPPEPEPTIQYAYTDESGTERVVTLQLQEVAAGNDAAWRAVQMPATFYGSPYMGWYTIGDIECEFDAAVPFTEDAYAAVLQYLRLSPASYRITGSEWRADWTEDSTREAMVFAQAYTESYTAVYGKDIESTQYAATAVYDDVQAAGGDSYEVTYRWEPMGFWTPTTVTGCIVVGVLLLIIAVVAILVIISRKHKKRNA